MCTDELFVDEVMIKKRIEVMRFEMRFATRLGFTRG
jgi:hypothetical protein